MRTVVAFIFMVLMAALVGCGVAAGRSEKPIAPSVRRLLFSLLPPVFGNFLIVLSGEQLIATIGCYTYYIGMDIMVMALFFFTSDYCNLNFRTSRIGVVFNVLMLVDIAQLLLNPIFHHAFALEPIIVEGYPYYTLVPFLPQNLHRVYCYGVFLFTVACFIYKCATAPRIYVERYAVILAAMIVGGIGQSFYIISGTPVDYSMVVFGLFGISVFFFALYYKPVRLLDRMLGLVVSGMHEVVIFYDVEGNCIYANDIAAKHLNINSEDDLAKYEDVLSRVTAGDPTFDASSEWSKDTDMDLGWGLRSWRMTYQPVRERSGRRMGASLILYDRTAAEVKLRHETYLATHDSLTGLYNQEKLYEVVERLVTNNPDTEYCVVGLDVNDFKMINDVFSREVGDRVLNVIATRLRKYASEHEVYGRLTGDKFGYVLPANEFRQEEIEARLADHNFMGSGMQYPIVIHMGVYRLTDPTVPVSVMFDRAFLALSSIKNDYQRHIAFYDDTMRDDILWSKKLAGELSVAIEERQLRPYLHPMVDDKGKVIGAEVLVRWIHPVEGFMPPGRFIPVLEKNGMVAQVDEFMWRCACEILADWKQRGIDLFLSVNISPKDFYFIDVLHVIRSLVEEYEVDPHRLRLEITETVMMTEMEKRLQILDELRKTGFLVEMDDFGSGYSSLNMLKDMPVDLLKIDMMFLYKTKDQRKAQLILQNIINLSGDLGIPSLTEGVETRDQRDMLLNMGCKMFQGYFFAKPMPLEEFEAFYSSAA